MCEESYGGHYGPVFAEHIEAQNAKLGPNITKIGLESLIIINGWMNPLIQVCSHGPRQEAHGGAKVRMVYTVRLLLQFHGILSSFPAVCLVLHHGPTKTSQVSPGNTYDYKPYNNYGAGQLYANVYHSGGCLDQLQNCVASGTDSVCATADRYCLGAVENFFDFVTGRDEYDVRQLAPDP